LLDVRVKILTGSGQSRNLAFVRLQNERFTPVVADAVNSAFVGGAQKDAVSV
jgi:hypothetical protein